MSRENTQLSKLTSERPTSIERRWKMCCVLSMANMAREYAVLCVYHSVMVESSISRLEVDASCFLMCGRQRSKSQVGGYDGESFPAKGKTIAGATRAESSTHVRRNNRDMLFVRSTSPTCKEEPTRIGPRAPAADDGRDTGRGYGQVGSVVGRAACESVTKGHIPTYCTRLTSCSISIVNLFFLKEVEIMEDQEWRWCMAGPRVRGLGGRGGQE